jgi:hypothetical protein
MADEKELPPRLDGMVGKMVELGTLTDEEQQAVLGKLSSMLGKSFTVSADSGVKSFSVGTSDKEDVEVSSAGKAHTTTPRRKHR